MKFKNLCQELFQLRDGNVKSQTMQLGSKSFSTSFAKKPKIIVSKKFDGRRQFCTIS